MVTLFRKRGKMEIDLPDGWQVSSTIFKESAKPQVSRGSLPRRGSTGRWTAVPWRLS